MSVKSELEELVKWLSALTDEGEEAADTEKLSSETWSDVGETLGRASKSFDLAADNLGAITSRPRSTALAEMARDLSYEAMDLARRAKVLARRAPSKAPPPKLSQFEQAVLERAESEADKAKAEAKKVAADAAVAEANQRMAELAREEDQAKRIGEEALNAFKKKLKDAAEEEEEARQPKPPLEAAAARLGSAQNTVETARGKLDETQSPDDVTTSFADELDVLAEMALGLRRRCEELTRSSSG